MPTLTIDDQQITVEPGTSVIEAARRLGIPIPHFCYHPHLSVAGNCRMCLVEVEKIPKPQISCSLIATEGMVVKTQSENAQKWRKNVLEFILINHPLDCPICDQAGECKLQDYYLGHSVKESRFEEEKVHKPKKFQLGPQVMLDDERCIMCSRCVRFCDEVSKTSELGFIERGNRVELRPFPGKKLDNPYSMNTVDLCPVGALTNADFRFQCRVWFLESASSICAGCARGCNIKLQSHQGKAYRYLPRENPEVNKVWLCDEGRLSYKAINAQDRLFTPHKKIKGHFEKITADQALTELAKQLSDHGFDRLTAVGNAQFSNENNFALKKFIQSLNPQGSLFYSKKEVSNPYADDLLIREDKNPNTSGVEFLGFNPVGTERLNAKVLFILGELSDNDLRKVFFNQPPLTVLFATHFDNATAEKADYILPVTTFAEEEGSFTNFEGRIQKFDPALKQRGQMRPSWFWLQEIAKRLGQEWELSPSRLLEEGFQKSHSQINEFGTLLGAEERRKSS